MALPYPVLFTSRFPDLSMGGQRSMLGLIRHLDRTIIRPSAKVPAPGELADQLVAADCPILMVGNVEIQGRELARRWYRRNSRRLRGDVARVRKVLLRAGVRAVHTDEEVDAMVFGLATRRTPVRHLYHVRVNGASEFDGFLPGVVDAFVGVSAAALRRFPDLPTPSAVIHNGVDADLFHPARDRAAVRASLGLGAGLQLLFAGQLKAAKGVLDLLRALGLLSRTQPRLDWHLSILGQPVEEGIVGQVAAAISEQGLDQRVRVVGFQANVQAWMQAADIVILVSHEGVEGLPRVLIEGMACGAVPVGSRTSGVDEVVTPESGALVPAGDPVALAAVLEGLMTNPERLARLREGAVRRAADAFDMRRTAREVEQFYAHWLV